MTVHPRQFLADASKDETILRLTTELAMLRARHEAELAARDAHTADLEAKHREELAAAHARIAELEAERTTTNARIAELEAKLGMPPKTPDNSSVPPSAARKASEPSTSKPKAKPHAGAHRALHPNPTRIVAVPATRCACGADVSGAAQHPVEAYDRIEIPRIEPDVTRVHLLGGQCACCGGTFKADAPGDMPRGSPFAPNLRALVIYLRAAQGIPFARLVDAFRDMFGLDVSEGALVNVLAAAREPFAAQTERIKADLVAGDAVESDETGVRVGKANWWLWVFQHLYSAVFLVDPHRSKAVVQAFLGDWRPGLWLSDRLGAEAGWALRAHQVCLAHLLRDAQYAIDAADKLFAPGLKGLLKRACAIGRRRDLLADSTLKLYRADLHRRLDRLLAVVPTEPAGLKLHKAVRKWRTHLFVFVTERALSATNNGSERSLRPCAVYRKITNGFRAEWGARLYADIRTAVETGRRRDIRAIDAIRLNLQGLPLPLPA